MKILSVNVGKPKTVTWKGEQVSTGIFKYPIDGMVQIHALGVVGDGQAEAKFHGGIDKAVYAYPDENRLYWRDFLNRDDVDFGMFGENLTTTGWLDSDMYIGDHWQFGEAVLMPLQPRIPCFKLGLRFGDASVTEHFIKARKFGTYFKVIKEGQVKAGDAIQRIKKSEYDLTIQDVVDNYVLKEKDMGKIRGLLDIPFFPADLKTYFSRFLK